MLYETTFFTTNYFHFVKKKVFHEWTQWMK